MTHDFTSLAAARALRAPALTLLLLFGAGCAESGPPDLPTGPIRGALLDSNPDGTLPPQVESGVSLDGADVLVAQAEPRDDEATPNPPEQPTEPSAEPESESDSTEAGESQIPVTDDQQAVLSELDAIDSEINAEQVDVEANATTDALANAAPADADSEEDAAEDAESEPVSDELVVVNFDDLSDFDYEPPTIDEIESGVERPQQIPDEILALDKRQVEVEGYMIPMDVEDGEVLTFILSRTLAGCCFGDMPNILEWVDVRMVAGETADYVPYAPVLVTGRLYVGESVDEYGITSVYRMTAETVEDPW